jgi:uncharacterized membrane protein YhfC
MKIAVIWEAIFVSENQMQHPVAYVVKTVKFATLFDSTDRVMTLFAEVR